MRTLPVLFTVRITCYFLITLCSLLVSFYSTLIIHAGNLSYSMQGELKVACVQGQTDSGCVESPGESCEGHFVGQVSLRLLNKQDPLS